MKNNSFKILIGRISGAMLVSSFVVINTVAAQIPVAGISNETNVTVKYLRSDTNSYVFNVAYNNAGNEKFLLRITDAAGNTLFTGTYSDKKFDKRFKVLREGSEGKINFVVKNLNDNSIQAFEVITTSKISEDVVVKKVM
jgi:hypothetical protein